MIEKFKFKSFVTADWKETLYEFFTDKVFDVFSFFCEVLNVQIFLIESSFGHR